MNRENDGKKCVSQRINTTEYGGTSGPSKRDCKMKMINGNLKSGIILLMKTALILSSETSNKCFRCDFAFHQFCKNSRTKLHNTRGKRQIFFVKPISGTRKKYRSMTKTTTFRLSLSLSGKRVTVRNSDVSAKIPEVLKRMNASIIPSRVSCHSDPLSHDNRPETIESPNTYFRGLPDSPNFVHLPPKVRHVETDGEGILVWYRILTKSSVRPILLFIRTFSIDSEMTRTA